MLTFEQQEFWPKTKTLSISITASVLVINFIDVGHLSLHFIDEACRVVFWLWSIDFWAHQSNVHSKMYQFGTLFVQKYLAFLKSFDRSDRLCSDKMASSITIMNGIPLYRPPEIHIRIRNSVGQHSAGKYIFVTVVEAELHDKRRMKAQHWHCGSLHTDLIYRALAILI